MTSQVGHRKKQQIRFLGFASSMFGQSKQNIHQMVVFHGDEFDGIESVQKSPKKNKQNLFIGGR